MNDDQLAEQIERTFPFVAKPKGIDLSFHKDDCPHCVFLRRDLEEYGGEELPPSAIRDIHQEMSNLSGQGWRWALPSYLRFCLARRSDHNQMETEFLIYNLSPDEKYKAETNERLSVLNREQIECLISFLLWCKEHEHWKVFCSEEIERGLKFLAEIRVGKDPTI